MFRRDYWKTHLAWGSCLGVAALIWALAKVSSGRTAILAASAVVGIPAVVDADEVRTFAVSVDGKPGGSYTIATAVAANGTETTTVTAELKVPTSLYTYTYSLHSTEVWSNGRVVSVDAKSNDDGKKKTVTAVASGDELTVTVNKQSRKTPAGVITSTGVRVPTGDKVRDVIFLDAEDGSETAVRVEPLGECRVLLNGKPIDGFRFKLTGKDVTGEWWFDRNGRSIRQDMKWDGHKVVFELSGIVN